MLLFTFRGRFRTLKGMLVSVIVGGVEGDTTGGRTLEDVNRGGGYTNLWSKHWMILNQ
jgi:hypothetical protein